MFGLPEDFDPTFLVGRMLMSLSISQFEVILRFDEQVRIQFHCDVAVLARGEGLVVSDAADAGKAMVDLLSTVVVAATGTTDGTLTVDFEDERSVRIFDSNEHYESYEIADGEKLVVV